MHEALEPTQDPGWLLSHQGYNVLTESAVESRLAFGNGFLGMRAARSVSRGPTWVAWMGYSRWASWPRCYVAGLFDMPNTEPPVPALVPVADWSRVRILLDGEPLLAREGEVILGTRQLDMRRGLLLSAWTHRTPAGITATGRELRLLSLADRAAGLQFLQRARGRARRHGGGDIDWPDGAPHQRRRRLCGVAVLAGDRRRRFLPSRWRGDSAGYGPVLGVPRRGGGGWEAAHPPHHRTGRIPRGRGRQRLHQRDGALEHRPRARGSGPAARALARPRRCASQEAGAWRRRACGLARRGRVHRCRPRCCDRHL